MHGTVLVFLICFILSSVGVDANTDGKVTYNPSASREENTQLWEKFNQQNDNRWRVVWNPVTETPRVSGHAIELFEPVNTENIKAVTRAILVLNQKLLQIKTDELVLSKADFDEPRNPDYSTGTWYVYYKQNYQGLRVEGGSVRLIIRNNKITTLASDYYPGIDISPTPEVSVEEAVKERNR